MSKIAIVTDTNSGITAEEAKKLGVFLLPMPFIVNGEEYLEGVNCTYEHFFEMLDNGDDVTTSQPAPDAITDLWRDILNHYGYDFVIHIPMSSALSGSCGTAQALAQDFGGHVFVVDNKRISITQRQSVLDALAMAEQGMEAADICKQLEEKAFDCSIYLAVNTLALLKKSGRVTAAGAALATLLGLKPVLQIQGEKLDAFAKVRGMVKARETMLQAISSDLENRFAGRQNTIALAYSGDLKPAKDWKKQAQEYFGDSHIELYRLPISICCHVGGGVLAIGCIPSAFDSES